MVCSTSIEGYAMFSTISQNCVFGHYFWTTVYIGMTILTMICLSSLKMMKMVIILLSNSRDILKSLAVSMVTKYRYIIFAAIVENYVLGHNFWNETHRMMILGSRCQMAPYYFVSQSVCLSIWPSIGMSVRPSISLSGFHRGVLLTVTHNCSCLVTFVIG